MTFSGPHHVDLDIVEPQSPVHAEALENARQYASAVTHSAMAQDHTYGDGMSSARLAGVQHEDVEREVIRVRNDHALEDFTVGETPGGGRTPGGRLVNSTTTNNNNNNRPASSGHQHSSSSSSATPGAGSGSSSRHSALSDQQLSSLLNSVPQPLANLAHLTSSLPTSRPARMGRNEPHDSILESLITSTQMSQQQPVASSSASFAQTLNNSSASHSNGPSNNLSISGSGLSASSNSTRRTGTTAAPSGGAFTSILRTHLASNVPSTPAHLRNASYAASGLLNRSRNMSGSGTPPTISIQRVNITAPTVTTRHSFQPLTNPASTSSSSSSSSAPPSIFSLSSSTPVILPSSSLFSSSAPSPVISSSSSSLSSNSSSRGANVSRRPSQPWSTSMVRRLLEQPRIDDSSSAPPSVNTPSSTTPCQPSSTPTTPRPSSSSSSSSSSRSSALRLTATSSIASLLASNPSSDEGDREEEEEEEEEEMEDEEETDMNTDDQSAASATEGDASSSSSPRCQVCGHTYQPPHSHSSHVAGSATNPAAPAPFPTLSAALANPLAPSSSSSSSSSPANIRQSSNSGPSSRSRVSSDGTVRVRIVYPHGRPEDTATSRTSSSTSHSASSSSSPSAGPGTTTTQACPTTCSLSSSASSTGRSRGGRSRRRFAQFLESEVRQAIDRVRARQLDIQETLQALDHLQNEAAVSGAAPTDQSDPGALESVQLEVVQDAQPMETALDANAITIERTRSSDIPPMDLGIDVTSITGTSRDSVLSTSGSDNNNIADSLATDPPSQQGRSTVSALSAELNRRIDHLNRLERNVSEITQRLSSRMRNLNEQRWRSLGQIRRRVGNAPRLNSSHLRERQERLRAHLQDINRRYRSPGTPRIIPEITITPSDTTTTTNTSSSSNSGGTTTVNSVSEAEAELARLRDSIQAESRQSSDPPRLTDVQRHIQNIRADIVRRRQQDRERQRTWHTLQRRHLHPHYAVSILDDTINRQNDGLQAAINRAIAGAFMGTGEAAVASNIVNLTHRIQAWDFTRFHIPDITDASVNVIVPHCKLHNDASCDISQDGRYLSTFVPSHRGFPDDTILAVFSLEPNSVGKCLFTKGFGPNAISVSLSPLSNFVLVGLAAKRLAWVFTPKQMVAQVYKLKKPMAGEDSMEHICDLMHPCDLDIRSHISVNSARWLPRVGEGVVYGTNRGDLHICRPGDDEKDPKSQRNLDSEGNESHSIRRNIMQMLGIAVPSTTSTSTQTIHRLRRTASTQTEGPNPAEHL